MPNTKLTRARWANHLHYSKLVYLVIAFLAYFVADMLFSITTYRSPNERRVDIELVAEYAEVENGTQLAQNALEAGQAWEMARDAAAGIDVNSEEYSVPLEVVEFVNLSYDPDSDQAYYGSQKFLVTLAAQEGDIFILSRPIMEQLVEQGLTVDLTPYIESGVIDPGERDLSRVTYPEYVEEGALPTGNTCIYALQADTLNGLSPYFYMPTEDMYMVMMVYSKNQDTVAVVMQSLIDQLEMTDEELSAAYAELHGMTLDTADSADASADAAGEPAGEADASAANEGTNE